MKEYNFKKIEKKIFNMMLSDHKHKTMKQFLQCKRCKAKVVKRKEKIKELGFADSIQYQYWKRVMQTIITKKDLEFYVKDNKKTA